MKIKLKEPFVISLGVMDHAENLVIKMRTNIGITGFGECSPFLTINGENMETCFIIGQLMAKALKGRNPLDISGCKSALNSIAYGNSSVKSAFDIALYDIASQHASLPLYEFLGGRKDKKLFTDYTVSMKGPEEMAQDAKKIKESGFKSIKIKLGGSKEEDLERLRKITDAVGSEIPLRIDANQGWDKETAIEILNSSKGYNIQFCEEPVLRNNIDALPEIRNKTEIPLMADESCCTLYDANKLIEINACQYFNIKLGKTSGIYEALQIIRTAGNAGIKMQIGGFLESRLAFTACAHLAFASEMIIFTDFDSPLFLAEDPVEGGIRFGAAGEVILPESNGLGAGIDEKFLKGLPISRTI